MLSFLEVQTATKFKLLEEVIPSSVPRKKLEDLEITWVHRVEVASKVSPLFNKFCEL